MNSTKTIDLLRKRNAQIQEELDKLKEMNAKYQNNDEEKKVTDLIADLEKIKEDWLDALERLNEQRDEYTVLVEELKQIRSAFSLI